MIPTLFCERQRGDMCRMHSINNYIGRELFNEEKFYNYCDNYDELVKGLNSRNMDGFAEGRSIVSFIMDKVFDKFLLLIPINSYSKSRLHLDIQHYDELLRKCDCFFEFNKNHIWVNKKIMKLAKTDAIFMHCLPANRGEEVTNEVMDGKQSVIWLEALNRIYVQKSIIEWCLK